MEKQRLIQVSIQLPMSELGRLSSLLDRLQRLLGAEQAENISAARVTPASETTTEESEENTAFDQNRFSALSRDDEPPQSSAAVQAEPAQIIPVQISAEMEADSPLPDFAGGEIKRQLPEAASAHPPSAQKVPWEKTPGQPPILNHLPDVLAVQAAAGDKVDAPRTAGLTEATDTSTSDSSKKTVLEERLTAAGSAPLMAEAVSLAFRRDDRRYDNGFPLY